MPNTTAFLSFAEARRHYLARRFQAAEAAMERYRNLVDYERFPHSDHRPTDAPRISVVIVAHDTGAGLLECLQSVFAQHGPRFEVILVDNGGNQSVHHQLENQPLLWIRSPHNLLPSESRNIGAHFARGEFVVFLDDDAIMSAGYLDAVCQTMADKTIVALRGRVCPKSHPPASKPPPHYDLGNATIPAELNLEGNMVICREAFQALGGFNPLIFGHEGKELSQRFRQRFPSQSILYCPSLVIRHDWAQGERLAAKQQRQAISKDFLCYLKEKALNTGVSILLRSGDNLAAAKDFIASLVEYNTYKPLEVLLWAKDCQQALAISRPFLSQLFIRVLPANANSLNRIGSQARYDNILIIDLPTLITSDVLSVWIQQQKADPNTVLLCSKQQITTLAGISINQTLTQLSAKLEHPSPTHTRPEIAPIPQEAPPSRKSETKPTTAPKKSQSERESKPGLTEIIRHTEEQIKLLEVQLSKKNEKIAALEHQYLHLPENAPEQQPLKDQLEDLVLLSCRLLTELKDAQDCLQELRIRRIGCKQ